MIMWWQVNQKAKWERKVQGSKKKARRQAHELRLLKKQTEIVVSDFQNMNEYDILDKYYKNLGEPC